MTLIVADSRATVEPKSHSGHSTLDVSIVIPVFNKEELTRNCLASLDLNTSRELRWEVIIVDNASSDGTPLFLTEAVARYPWLRVIRNDVNIGFSRACNQGVRASNAPAILLLNNDTEAQPGWLEPMIRTLYSETRVAAVGSKLLFPDGTIQHAGVFIFNSENPPDPLLPQHIYFRKPADYPEAQLRRVYSAITGACILLKRAAYDAIGGLDEEYWNGYEDVDLCFKLKEQGWVCVYEPESILIHFESQSGPERFRRVAENVRLLQEKWLTRIKPDFHLSSGGEITRLNCDGIYRFAAADDLTFADILPALRRDPPSSLSMEVPVICREKPAITMRPSIQTSSRYNVLLVEPADYEHSNAFLEVGELLVESLTSLGRTARLQRNFVDPDAINIVLGYQLLPEPRDLERCRHVIYQLEQLSDREGWFRPEFLDILNRADEVWDYSDENISFLRRRGVPNLRLLPIGFHDKLRRITRKTQDIDVLFYGSLNPRRRAILDEIAKFATVKCLVGVYGEVRDAYIARSKIVLNLHFYEAQIMEQVRIAYLLNNHSLVISEDSPQNPFGDAIIAVPYADIVETVRGYLDRPKDCYLRAKQSFQAFKECSMINHLEPLLSIEGRVARPAELAIA